MRVLAWIAAIAIVAGLARAQTNHGAGALPGPDAQAWLIEPDPQPTGYFLVHLPPRAGAGQVVPAGTARRVHTLQDRPIGMGAIGTRVYLVFADRAGAVLSINAEPVGAGLYRYVPSGRMRAEPAVGPGAVAVTSCADRLWVLRRTEGTLHLLELTADGWQERTTPAVRPRADVWLAGDATDLSLIEHAEGGWIAHSARVHADGVDWSDSTPIAPGDDVVGFAFATSELVAISRAGAHWRARVAQDGREIAAFDTLTGPAGWVLASNSSRLIVLSTGVVGEGLLDAPPRQIDEVSLLTGRTLYTGDVGSGSVVSAEDARWLAIALVALLACAVFYILRSERTPKAVPLPPGASLAEPGRRLTATFIDWLLGAVLASLAMGAGVVPVALVAPALALPGGAGDVASAWVAALVLSVLVEGVTGASLGKRMVGCGVTRVGPDWRRPGLTRTAIRQVFKWSFVPWAAAGVSSLERRHRGDVAAGCAVVVLDPDGEASARTTDE